MKSPRTQDKRIARRVQRQTGARYCYVLDEVRDLMNTPYEGPLSAKLDFVEAEALKRVQALQRLQKE